MNEKVTIGLCLLLLAFTNCSSPKELPYDKYGSWIANEDNGLIKSKVIQNVKITARYLPAQWLAYQEWKAATDTVVYDTVYNSYKCGLVFQLTLQADKEDRKYGNLMYYNTSSQEEVTQRIEGLNFNIESFLFMQYKDTDYVPVLSHFEGFDQIGNRATFLVSFIVPDFNCGKPVRDLKDFKLVYEDPVWNLGTNYFEFNSDQVTGVPRLLL